MYKAFAPAACGIIYVLCALPACSLQEEMPAKPAAAPTPSVKVLAPQKPPVAEKPPVKAPMEKARGDVGLVELDKNYLIIVTKEGKLLTLDFDQKTKIIKVTPTPGKMSEIGLGSSATVTYTKEQGKNSATSLEYTPAKAAE